MKKEFDRKVILVTGAGSGIGDAAAHHLANLGANVMVADLQAASAEKVAEEIRKAGGLASAYAADVADEKQVEAMVAEIVKDHGSLYGAVNNAGISGTNQPTADSPIARWKKTIDVNLTSVFLCMHFQIPAMLKSGGGSIVNIASILGSVGFANSGDYVAAKHGVVGLTKAVAWEYGGQNIRVNSIGPGFIETPLMLKETPPEVLKTLKAKSAMNRFGTGQEVAELIAFLLSERSSFVTGSYHLVDGGYTAV